MEFSYRVSEAEYFQAWKLRQKLLMSKYGVTKTILFWVFILICLSLLWAVVQRPAHGRGSRTAAPAAVASSPQPSANATSRAKEESNPELHALENFGPMILLAIVWLLVLRAGASPLRRLYREDPAMQGQFAVNITPDSITTQNTAGTFSKSGWDVYESWTEGKDLIVLAMRSQAHLILNLAGLSDYQRNELRAILSTALPQK